MSGISFCLGGIISLFMTAMLLTVAGMLGRRDLLSWDWGGGDRSISADLGSCYDGLA